MVRGKDITAMSLIFKIAREQFEFDQLHELNYQTFVEEIPQHEENEERRLTDKFHEENTYVICLKKEEVVGMICVRSKRPFSLDGKIGRVEDHLPVYVQNPCEIRLLAVRQEYRNGRAFLGLVQALIRYCLKRGYDAALISGTTRELKLYGQLGFQPFAYLTGSGDAAFQPMYLTKETFDAGIAGRILREQVYYLPGPANISEDVTHSLASAPISHRSAAYEALLDSVRSRLKDLVNARHVQLIHGTGTLANDLVAAQLSLMEGKGLILVNGEFGERLVDHAERFGLSFDQARKEWGAAFTYEDLAEVCAGGEYKWLWAVHSETSTGVLNDLEMLKMAAERYQLKLCMDCISSIGAVEIDLSGVSFASGVSGKALGSYTGLSFVFHEERAVSSRKLPRYLDLGAYDEADGLPYSQSSNLAHALEAALKKYDIPEAVYMDMQSRYRYIRERLEAMGLNILSQWEESCPAIMTVILPCSLNSRQLGDDLYLNGYGLHYESSYLLKKNWLQISCINDISEKETDRMLKLIETLVQMKRQPAR